MNGIPSARLFLPAAVALLLQAAAPGAEPTESAAGAASAPTPGAEPAPTPSTRPATVIRPDKKPVIQNRNPFRIGGDLLVRDASGVAEMLLEVYDPGAGQGGRWKGYGLMDLTRERPDGDGPRTLHASIDFQAPAEGVYCLRTRARDRAGNVEVKSDDLCSVDWIVVLDRTAPRVRLLEPAAPAGGALEEGRTLVVRWEAQEDFPAAAGGNVVEVSGDGGLTWKEIARTDVPGSVEWQVTGPATDAFRVRVAVRDAAGNVGLASTDESLTVLEVPAELRGPSDPQAACAARQAYGRGVAYMVRGDLKEAAVEFEEAIRLSRQTMPAAYLDLSATYLRLYDQDPQFNRRYLLRACELCAEGVKLFPKEIRLKYNLAQGLYRRRDLKGAAASLRAALAGQPRHIESRFMLAQVRREEGDLDEACKLWTDVAVLGGRDNPLARRAVACLGEVQGLRK